MVYFFSIFIGTLVFEDVSLIASLALVQQQKMAFSSAFLACFLGIAIGDIGLYLIGYGLHRWGLQPAGCLRFNILQKTYDKLKNINHSNAMTYSVVVSRFIPGTRLPTYLTAGFVRFSFPKFTVLTIFTVFIWVGGAFVAGHSIQAVFTNHWFLMALTFLLGFNIFKNILAAWLDPWKRKSILHSWRKWCHFEFWPAWLFYIPIVPIYVYFSFKYRSVFTPFYTHPHVKNGGLIGESKWSFLKYLRQEEPSTLKSIKIDENLNFELIRAKLEDAQLQYPLIIKPDVGQRGFGVRIIRNDSDLTEYLNQSDFAKIIQPLSVLPQEAGLFYIRIPSADKGHIFSITTKKFPVVVGDGHQKLGDLILSDHRARIMPEVYFARHKGILDSIPKFGESIQLSECGNHCQGAIFKNGNHLNTQLLTDELDRISKQIPDFYFGRFDIRYQDDESLKKGLQFEILEINGAGSEATHIWDANTTIFEAYATLFEQWSLLFEIGSQVRTLKGENPNVSGLTFAKESIRVFFRKSGLSVSS